MQLMLTPDDARLLRDILHDYLPTLQFEAARTEAKEFRHQLILRQNLVERLLAELADDSKLTDLAPN
jgi:hypothetical protein